MNYIDNRQVLSRVVFIQGTKAGMVEDWLSRGHTVEPQKHMKTLLQYWCLTAWMIIIWSWNA